MAAKRSLLDQISRYLEALAKNARANKTVSGAVISAILGGVFKLSELTGTFPPPADLIGNIIIFAAVLFIAVDICKGGLFD
jgi:SNF family Na+-dependent transporter